MITIVEKLELGENGEQQSTPVGYTENVHLINEINEQYDANLGAFIGGNRTKLENGVVSLSTFFNATPFVHEARISTESIEGLDLEEITDINSL